MIYNEELEPAIDRAVYLNAQFKTQLRNLHLAYMHAITQSSFELSFYENGAIKSIAPKGRRE